MDVDMRDDTRAAPQQGGRGAARGRREPREVSIKGSSGPTRVVIANMAPRTSMEDVKVTFESLGRITDIRGLAYEVSYASRQDALAACRQYHGVLADGHVLQVTLQREPREPREPRDARDARDAREPREAREPRAPRAKADKPATSARLEEEQLPLPVLRRLAEAEARYLAETERILRTKDAPAPRASGAKPASLKDRLGSLPLAQRLAQAAPGGPKSASEKVATSKSARRRRAAAQKGGAKKNAMDVE